MFLTKTKQLFSKPEAAFGQFSDPTDKANSYATPVDQTVRLQNVEWSVEPEMEDTSYLTGTSGKSISVIGKQPAKITADFFLAPGEFIKDETLGTANEHTFEGLSIWNSLGFEVIDIKDVVADASYDQPIRKFLYPSVSAWEKSISHSGVIKDTSDGSGVGRDFVGCMANGTISASGIGKPISIKYEASGGAYSDNYDISAVNMGKLAFDPTALIETLPNKYMAVDITITDLTSAVAYTQTCSTTLELALGNVITSVDCQGSEFGSIGSIITDKKSTLKLNPRFTKVATFDWAGKISKMKLVSVKIEFMGHRTKDDVEYIPLTVFIPRAQLVSAPYTDDNGIIRVDANFNILGNQDKTILPVNFYEDGTGDELPFVFTGSSIIGNEFGADIQIVIEEDLYDTK